MYRKAFSPSFMVFGQAVNVRLLMD